MRANEWTDVFELVHEGLTAVAVTLKNGEHINGRVVRRGNYLWVVELLDTAFKRHVYFDPKNIVTLSMVAT